MDVISPELSGDTLVVDTTNYKPRAFLGISSEKLQVTERISRQDAETLRYEITVNDPDTWRRPWSMMIPLQRSAQLVYEYACHEGSIGLAGILAGARADESQSVREVDTLFLIWAMETLAPRLWSSRFVSKPWTIKVSSRTNKT